ncbi:MAG: hypothetical protein RJA99_3345 [Pseudomonadota bacterium]|jgi:chromosome partitioning protein
MPTIVFANQKGGVGKSTLSCHFAWWLREHGYPRVLVVDLDAQGNTSRTMTAAVRLGRSAALFGASAPAIGDLADGLSLLAADASLADVDALPAGPAAFRRNLETVAAGFDAVVIDTPPALGRRMVAALVAADHVACPIELEPYSIDALANMLKTVHGVRRRWNPRLHLLGVLANRFNHHSAAQKAALAALLARYAEFVLPARISTRSSIAEALSAGRPVWQLPRTSAREASVELERAFTLMLERMTAGTPAAMASGAGA